MYININNIINNNKKKKKMKNKKREYYKDLTLTFNVNMYIN